MKYVVDLKNIDSIEALHQTIARSLQLPKFYGENLDAFYDILQEMPQNTKIVFRHCSAFQKAENEYFNALINMCKDTGLKIYFRDRKRVR